MPMPRRLPAHVLSCRRWSVVEAKAVLEALAASDLSARDFAEHHGLDVERVLRWRRVVAKKDRLHTRAFVEVQPRAVGVVEVVLRAGQTLRVSESVDVAALRRIVDALEALGC